MKNNKFIIALLFIASLLSSCEDELELAPLDTISDSKFWKVKEDFEKAANDFYHSLGTHGGGALDRNSDTYVGNVTDPVSGGTYIASGEDSNWDNSYEMIRSTSRLLENYETATEIQADIDRYAAEARFFRARAYFTLVTRFGDVPLIKRVLDIDSEELYAPRAPRADVVAFIFEDLDWAASKLPNESGLAATEKGRITRGAALALKSRVALFEGTWAKYHGAGGSDAYLTKCIEASQQLMALNEYALYEHSGGPEKSYYNLFIEGGTGSSENILVRKYSEELNIIHNTTRAVDQHNSSPTKLLADMYLCSDGLPIDKSPLFQGYDLRASEFESRDPRMSQTIMIPGVPVIYSGYSRLYPVIIGSGTNGPTKSGYLPYKFQSDTEIAGVTGRSSYDYIEIRLGEIYLNLAEAIIEKNGAITDSELDNTINKLRDRAGMPHLTNDFVTANGLDMKQEIRRERTVELAAEGFRFNDLRRWKEVENALVKSLLGVKFVGTEWPTIDPNDKVVVGVDLQVDANGFVIADDASNRQFQQKHYLFPLPLNQLQLNTTLTQNPDW